jgi:hypothetical protein
MLGIDSQQCSNFQKKKFRKFWKWCLRKIHYFEKFGNFRNFFNSPNFRKYFSVRLRVLWNCRNFRNFLFWKFEHTSFLNQTRVAMHFIFWSIPEENLSWIFQEKWKSIEHFAAYIDWLIFCVDSKYNISSGKKPDYSKENWSNISQTSQFSAYMSIACFSKVSWPQIMPNMNIFDWM